MAQRTRELGAGNPSVDARPHPEPGWTKRCAEQRTASVRGLLLVNVLMKMIGQAMQLSAQCKHTQVYIYICDAPFSDPPKKKEPKSALVLIRGGGGGGRGAGTKA
eukprot:COSAG06_NODE_6795_length_2778_cov_386.053751_1_plen_104_part_10